MIMHGLEVEQPDARTTNAAAIAWCAPETSQRNRDNPC